MPLRPRAFLPLALQHHALNRQEAALLMISLLSPILRMLARSRMLAARRLLVSVASTMISSQAVCSRISVSLPPAVSATMPLPIMDSKIARPHASLDGANKDALTAQNQRKMILPLVQASPLALQHHAWINSLLDWLRIADIFMPFAFLFPFQFCWQTLHARCRLL